MHWYFAWNLQFYHLTPIGISHCRLPRAKGTPYIGKSCVFEPSFKHRSQYLHCVTYEGLVTVDDAIAQPGVFNIVMTNKSNKHIKIHSGKAMGMLCSCKDSKICKIHLIVSFARNPKEGRDDTSDLDTTKGTFYFFYPVQVNEAGPQHDYVHYRKPSWLDAPVDKQTRDDLDRLTGGEP